MLYIKLLFAIILWLILLRIIYRKIRRGGCLSPEIIGIAFGLLVSILYLKTHLYKISYIITPLSSVPISISSKDFLLSHFTTIVLSSAYYGILFGLIDDLIKRKMFKKIFVIVVYLIPIYWNVLTIYIIWSNWT